MPYRSHTEEYERARSAFDQLKVDDRAVFLVEATVSTLARGVEEVGRAASQILDDLFKGRSPFSGAPGSEAGNSTPPSEEVPPHNSDTPGTHTET